MTFVIQFELISFEQLIKGTSAERDPEPASVTPIERPLFRGSLTLSRYRLELAHFLFALREC